MEFERRIDPKESMKVGLKHRYMKITWISLEISIKTGDNEFTEKIEDVDIKDDYIANIEPILGLLSSNNIDLKTFLKYVRIRTKRSRWRLRRAKKIKQNLIVLIETGASWNELERINAIYKYYKGEIDGLIFQDKMYPIAKGHKNLIY